MDGLFLFLSCGQKTRRDKAQVRKDDPLLVIEAGRTERHYWRDLWAYRELFLFLA